MNNEKLAKERTTMADERTLLAYIRTALNLFIFGIAIHKFYPETNFLNSIFKVSVLGGILLICFGLYRFNKLRSKLK